MWAAWVGLGDLAMRLDCNPTQRAVVVVRFSQLRSPAALLPIRGFMLCVGTAIRAGLSDSGDRIFSSDSALASPDSRASFVLRDHGHIKGELSQFGLGVCSEQEPSQQRIRQSTGGERADPDRR